MGLRFLCPRCIVVGTGRECTRQFLGIPTRRGRRTAYFIILFIIIIVGGRVTEVSPRRHATLRWCLVRSLNVAFCVALSALRV